MSNIEKLIGRPALLEQVAEECNELGHASLKMARKLRGENYTPKDMSDIRNDLMEEVADVMLCVNELLEAGIIDERSVSNMTLMKKARWEARLAPKEMA